MLPEYDNDQLADAFGLSATVSAMSAVIMFNGRSDGEMKKQKITRDHHTKTQRI